METQNTSVRHSELVSESSALSVKIGRSRNNPPRRTEMTNFYGFSLVELIVVITVLVIIGTIAFINLGGFQSSARDSSRVSDMTNISKGLEMVLVRNGTVPVPEAGSITVSASWVVIGYQGYAEGSVLSAIKMSEAKDPLDKKYYTYSTNVAYTKYEMLGLMEDPGTLSYGEAPSPKGRGLGWGLIDTAYAGYETRTPATKGSALGVLLGNTGASLNVPVQEIGAFTGIDLVKTTTLSGYTMVFSKNDTTASVATSGTGAYTGSLFTFAYNKRDDLIVNKTLAGFDPSLVGYWDMETVCSWGVCGGAGNDGKLKDFSKNGNYGTLIGNIAPGNSNGLSGKGISFVSGAYVQIQNTASIAPLWKSDLNYTVFVQANYPVYSSGAYSMLIKKYLNGTTPYPILNYYWNSWSQYLRDMLKGTGSGTGYNNNENIFGGEFNQFAYSINRNDAKYNYYYNWTLMVRRDISSIGDMSNAENVIIGNHEGATYGYWDGTIDEVRIYNRALSDSEIQTLYQATK